MEASVVDDCTNVRCGPNAECVSGQCQCLPEYHGDPYFNCRPECVFSTDCDPQKACVQRKCVDPCVGACGQNAICQVVNHIPMCSCNNGYTGNSFIICNPIRGNLTIPHDTFLISTYYNFVVFLCKYTLFSSVPSERPCSTAVCGPNSQCREINNQAVCSCLPTYLGIPPACRPECVSNSECPQNQACMKQKCINPCIGVCGVRAVCEVVNHNPVCACTSPLSGDPFIQCTTVSSEYTILLKKTRIEYKA